MSNASLNFRPGSGRIGDTIPFFWEGEYHVFYLLCDAGPVIPWEHIVSTDLVHWSDLPTALAPDPSDPRGADGHHMFTGCVVESAGTFHIFYTGFNPDNPEGREIICHATSTDLVRWTKHPSHRFRADGVTYLNRDFRDPFVFWHEEERAWWMLLCACDAKTGLALQGRLRSRDLVRWEQLPPLEFDPPLREGETGTPECPDLFRLGEEWILLYTRRVQNVRRAPALLGPWRPARPAELDTPQLLSGKSMFDGNRRIYVGPVSGRGDPVMCIPRDLRAGSGGGLSVLPVAEAVAAFPHPAAGFPVRKPFGVPSSGYRLDAPVDCLLEVSVSLAMEAELTLAIRGTCELVLKPLRREIELDGMVRTCDLPTDRPVRVQAFVQGTVVECFVDDRFALTCRLYDNFAGTLGLSATGGRVDVLTLDARTTG